MSFPTAGTNLFGPDVPVNIPVPSPGNYNYFFNSNDLNRIWYKNSDAQFYVYDGVVAACDPCLCEMANQTICSWNQALQNGTLTETTYLALLTAGVTFTCVTNGVTNTFTITISA